MAKKKIKIDAVALEGAALKAGVADELMKIWRHGSLSNESFAKLVLSPEALAELMGVK